MRNDIFSTKIEIRPSEIDPYRIVHHACYLNWIELCEVHYIKKYLLDDFARLSYSENGRLVQFKCRYIHSIYENETIVIKMKCKEFHEMQAGYLIKFQCYITNGTTNKKAANISAQFFYPPILVHKSDVI